MNSVADIIKNRLKELGKSQNSLARDLGETPQNFSQKLKNGTLKASEFFNIIEFLGLEASFYDKDTGVKSIIAKEGIAPKLKMTVNGKVYDTNKSKALCHTTVGHGLLITELYKDIDDNYFFVVCSNDNVKPAIIEVDKNEAAAFYEQFKQDGDEPTEDVFGKM